MKKIMVLGSTGMAGHLVTKYLEGTIKYEVINVSFRTKLDNNTIIIDIKNDNLLCQLISNIVPDVIINCIGILIRGSKNQPDNAIYINSYFPHHLSLLAKEIGSRIIHISTDCIFSGKSGSYLESSIPDARNIYGRSKALGELDNDRDLTIRTSIIGPELKNTGEGLFHWLVNSKNVSGYTQVFWGGVTTLELAKAIEYSIDNSFIGLVNLTNGKKISKYNLLMLIKEKANLKIQINKDTSMKYDKSLKTSRSDFCKVAGYQKMIGDLINWIEINYQLYESIYPKIIKGK